MKDENKTKKQLINELREVRRRISKPEKSLNRTERKRTEEKLRKYHEHLENQVEERTSKLKEANKRLQQEITERMRAVERFRSIFENSMIGMYLTTPDGQILMANPALVRMLGYSSFVDILQLNLEENGYHLQYPRSTFKELMEAEGEVVELESAWLKKNGNILYVCESARSVLDDAGNVLYYEGTVEDITERKRAEDILKKTIANLEESFNKLKKTQTKLIRETKLASIGRIAAAVAHEVNNPLEAIKIRVQFLQEELSGRENSKEFVNDLKVIDEQVNRVTNIVKNLLEFSRIKIKKLSLANVNHLLKNIIDLEKYVLKSSGIKTTCNFDKKVPEILIDTEGIQQVFLNIIRNAMDAMNDKGELEVITSQCQKEEKATIYIKDTGIGINQKDKGKIFDPFFTTKSEGTGLGLAICLTIIEQHNGTIEIESAAGKGTQVRIELPIRRSKRVADDSQKSGKPQK